MHNSQIYFWCWLWLRHVAKKSRIWNGFSGFPEAWGRTTTTTWPTVQLTNKKKIHYSHFNCTHTDFNWPKFATKIPSSIFDLKFPPCPSEEATKPRRENKSFQIDFTLVTHPLTNYQERIPSSQTADYQFWKVYWIQRVCGLKARIASERSGQVSPLFALGPA